MLKVKMDTFDNIKRYVAISVCIILILACLVQIFRPFIITDISYSFQEIMYWAVLIITMTLTLISLLKRWVFFTPETMWFAFILGLIFSFLLLCIFCTWDLDGYFPYLTAPEWLGGRDIQVIYPAQGTLKLPSIGYSLTVLHPGRTLWLSAIFSWPILILYWFNSLYPWLDSSNILILGEVRHFQKNKGEKKSEKPR